MDQIELINFILSEINITYIKQGSYQIKRYPTYI
jgi:hypothetical protein